MAPPPRNIQHLKDLSPQDIQDFYSAQLKRVKASTVIHYHAAIHKALEHAVRMNLITYNPADRVDRPKKIPYNPTFYDVGQLQNLFTLTKDDPLWLLIRLTAFYGFRRSEVVGLKWSAISFKNNRIEVDHTVTQIRMNGKKQLIQKDRAKNKSSIRSMPLVTTFKDDLVLLKKHQDEMKTLCGNCYNHEFDEYIFVDDIGNLLKPDYVSGHFEWLLKANGLPKMRFHDLRHSCASLLLDCGVSMKQIQEWLGHSDFNTTANLYAHLQSESKMNAANTMASALKLDEIENDNREKAV